MADRDHYYNKSKQEGYRARSAYKLTQIDDEVGVLDAGQTVLDLGAAPGGWLQVAAERVGESGRVLGVDRQRIDPIEGVETLRGDLADEETREELRETLAADGDPETDVVLSDMAPNMTGEYDLDHARSIGLAEIAREIALDVLAPGGALVVKVFDGRDLAEYRRSLEREFEWVRSIRPDATRDASSEQYLVANGRLTAPVRAGDRLEVEIEATGDEGDGVAKVDAFTLFVPGTDVGDAVRVEVTDVKPRYGFAEVVESA